MWKQIRAFLPAPKPSQLNISSHGQDTCGLPFEQIKEVMEWLGLSLIAADYRADAHIIWDSPENPIELGGVLKKALSVMSRYFCIVAAIARCHHRPATTGD